MKRKKYEKINHLLTYILIFLVPIVLFLGAYYIYDTFIKEEGIPSVNNLIKEKEKINYQDKDDNKQEVESYVNELPNVRAEYNNENIMGRIEIPNLNINALVTRASDNRYYLNYNLYNQYDALGVPFFDFRNTDLLQDRQINIYGHNTRNEKYYDSLPFTNLEAYVDKNIFDNYKDVYLSIDEAKLHYEVIAIKIITTDATHMVLNFSSNQDYLQHLYQLTSNSLYSDNVTFKEDDRILVLQICHYHPNNSYLLVICKEKK